MDGRFQGVAHRAVNVALGIEAFQQALYPPQDQGEPRNPWLKLSRKTHSEPLPTPPSYPHHVASQIVGELDAGVCAICRLDYHHDPVQLLDNDKCGHDLCKDCYGKHFSRRPAGCGAPNCTTVLLPGDFKQLKSVQNNGVAIWILVAYPDQITLQRPTMLGASPQSASVQYPADSAHQNVWLTPNPRATNHQPQQRHPFDAVETDLHIFDPQRQYQGQSRTYYDGHPQSSPDPTLAYLTPTSMPRPSFASNQTHEPDFSRSDSSYFGLSTHDAVSPVRTRPSPSPQPRHYQEERVEWLEDDFETLRRSQTFASWAVEPLPNQFLSPGSRMHTEGSYFDRSRGF